MQGGVSEQTPFPEPPRRRRVDAPDHGGALPAPRARRRGWRQRLATVGATSFAILALASTVLYTAAHIKPIYMGQPKLAERVVGRLPGEVIAATPADSLQLEARLRTPEFERDRKAFAQDLVATGRMDPARADSIALYAVREAYLRGIPPALIFGVMLTENAQFVSRAKSNVGAVGLMQVYPKVWLKALRGKFGGDLESDSTNLKYGTFILAEYLKPKDRVLTAAEVNKGLLRYNGCVRGTNTPNCKTYPSKIAKYVERDAGALCGDKSFYDCIARPFVKGLLGEASD